MTVAIDHSSRSADGQTGQVVIRSSKPDPYEGLKGHAYIKARNLNPPVQRVQTSAQIPNAQEPK